MVRGLTFLTNLTRSQYGQDFLWKISRLSGACEPGLALGKSLPAPV
jgi:hypothetical protein